MVHRIALFAVLFLAPLVVLPAGCTTGPPNPDDASGDQVACFWEFTPNGDTALSGDYAVHAFSGELLPFFNLSLSHSDGPGASSGTVRSTPGPSAGESGQFDADLSIVAGARVWAVGEDAEETSATLTVERNTTSEFEGTISGTCLTAVDGESVTRAFTLKFRAAHGVPGAPGCSGS